MPIAITDGIDVHPRSRGVKAVRSIAEWAMERLRVNARRQLTPGFALFGYNLFVDPRAGHPVFRGSYALEYCLGLKPRTVIDVGSGGGAHAEAFMANGADVLCVDYGRSVYAEKAREKGLKVIHVDFNEFEPPQKFDMVWVSHILEHQRNVGIFLERVINCCSPEGHICITVPDPHRALLGGHVNQWQPGLLAYNIVLCGIDLSESHFIRGYREMSIVFQPKKTVLPDLAFDNGDVRLLKPYFPPGFNEDEDAWRTW